MGKIKRFVPALVVGWVLAFAVSFGITSCGGVDVAPDERLAVSTSENVKEGAPEDGVVVLDPAELDDGVAEIFDEVFGPDVDIVVTQKQNLVDPQGS